MAFKSNHLFFALTLLLLGCPAPENTPDASLNDAAPSPLQDTDGDTITDIDEAERDARDTDMDGTPDFMDDDSDGDGLADSLEAGDSDPSTPPVDSDSDGIPDYIDVDSDDNGIEDGVEGVGDTDGDRRPDYVDLDDDNDGLPDVIVGAGLADRGSREDAGESYVVFGKANGTLDNLIMHIRMRDHA